MSIPNHKSAHLMRIKRIYCRLHRLCLHDCYGSLAIIAQNITYIHFISSLIIETVSMTHIESMKLENIFRKQGA